jgi:hypothetical protein
MDGVDQVTVSAWEYGCVNLMAAIAFFAAVGYILWWIFDTIEGEINGRNKRNRRP